MRELSSKEREFMDQAREDFFSNANLNEIDPDFIGSASFRSGFIAGLDYRQTELDRLAAENTQLRAALAAERDESGYGLAAENARLRAALEPFAACAEVWSESESERVLSVCRRGYEEQGLPDLVITVGDILKAREALQK